MESLIVVIIFVVVFLLNSSGKKKKKNDGTPVPNRPREGQVSRPNRPRQQNFSSVRNAAANAGSRAKKAASGWAKQLYEADADRHSEYDQASLDYCDSDVPASGGISFRDLPPGSDELAYLNKWNRSREKLLEQSLESRG